MRCQESAGVPSTPAAVVVHKRRKSCCFLPALAVRLQAHKQTGIVLEKAPSNMSVASKNPFALLEGLCVSKVHAESEI